MTDYLVSLTFLSDVVSNHLLLLTEVRWLSKSTYLHGFYKLLDSVIQFLGKKDTEVHNNLITLKNNIAY